MYFGHYVIVSYRDERTRDFARGKPVKAFSGFEMFARLKLDRMEAAASIRDLAALPGNRFEALVGDRKGQHSSVLIQSTPLNIRIAPDSSIVLCQDASRVLSSLI
jgi:plasmid maintenance system killer protein